jgi:RNA recognition motif-containing protein
MQNNSNRLFVGGLSFGMDKDALTALFKDAGFEVVDAFIVKDRETQRSKGYGFVTLGVRSNPEAAIAALNGRVVGARELTVNKANPKAVVKK